MNAINRLWREPLVHFLLIGVALFLLFEVKQEQGNEAPNRIVVNPSQVEQLSAQFRRTWLRSPSEDELAGLIEGYVRDEVYYREALAMGLDQNDPQVRMRMRLKLEFLLEDLSVEAPPTDKVLQAYLQQHADKFRTEPQVSFQHVYLNPDIHRDLEADVQNVQARLKRSDPAASLGDPTLLSIQYTQVVQDDIARRFGEAFAQRVVDLSPGEWSGPLVSQLGVHLVQVSDRVASRLPALAEVREQVEREYLAARRQELKDMAYQNLRAGYEVLIETAVNAGNDEAITMDESTPAAQATETKG